MLRLSKLTDYGTVIMSYMTHEPERIRSAGEVAEAVGVAQPTVSKILKTLARAGLLHSLRGAKGGYMLARPPAQISVAEVIDAMEGHFSMTECGNASSLCVHDGHCSIQVNWQDINQVIRDALSGITLVDMAQPSVISSALLSKANPVAVRDCRVKHATLNRGSS